MESESKNRAAVWCAVSDPQQAVKGKESLPTQEAEGRAVAERLGLEVVAVLTVPGFSRDYLSITECAADMMKERPPVTAMSDLIRLMETRGFDVFICRDADRFGRTQSLISYIVEYIVKIMGARIYATSKGLWVDKSNFRMWAAMSGFQAAGELDTFKLRHAMGMEGRYKKGLPAAKVPLSHRYVRNDKGEPEYLIVDPAKTRLLDDLAEALVNHRVAYDKLGKVLYEQHGHTNPKSGQKGRPANKPYSNNTFRTLLYNPWFWGNKAIHTYAEGQAPATGEEGRWVYDPSSPLPDDLVKSGMKVTYNTHPAAYSGELAHWAEPVKAELRRRENLKGTASPDCAYAYTSLLKCGLCGYSISGNRRIFKRAGVPYESVTYRCSTGRRSRRSSHDLPECPGPGFIHEHIIDEAVRGYLELAFRDSSFMLSKQTRSRQSNMELLLAEIAGLKDEIGAMIDEQSGRKGSARALYASKIDQMGERLDKLQAAYEQEQQALAGEESLTAARQYGLTAIRAVSADDAATFVAMGVTDKGHYNQMVSTILSHIRIFSKDKIEIEV